MPFSKQLMKGITETIVLHTINQLGEAYGYQLAQAIKEQGDGSLEMQEGTLYPLLYRLENKELVKSTVKQAASGKDRRYYSLTAKGKKLLVENKRELKSFFLGVRGALNLSV
jgi:PadR family transcriptional regulator PadR